MYDFRSTNIPIPRARTETYRCSFFPSIIRSWDCLDPLVRNANTIKDFKKKLNKSRNDNPYYLMGSRCINSILASMRMHCCQLKSDILGIIYQIIGFALVVMKRPFFIFSLNVETIQMLGIFL